jgi:hypothetical protein
MFCRFIHAFADLFGFKHFYVFLIIGRAIAPSINQPRPKDRRGVQSGDVVKLLGREGAE